MEIIHVKIDVPAENRAAFLEVARTAESATQEDAGCLYYRFHESIDEPGAYVLVEEWTDADALAAHIAQPHVEQYRKASAELVATSEAVLFEVASSKLL
jgi:quinol monooxygenase YgiN